jgi:ABC-2 type transport system permease protein
VCSLGIWGFVFVVSLIGFWVLQTRIPLTGDIVGTLFDILFLSLGVMLTFSSGIILYSSLFTTPEAAFLLGTPARADQVFAHNYQGAIAFSSWAFVLLGSPILIAYGIAYGLPPLLPTLVPDHPAVAPNLSPLPGVAWYFYALLPLYFFGFVLVPGSLGALVCLLVVNFLPRRRKQVLLAAGLAVVLLAGLVIFRLTRTAQHSTWNRDLVQQLFGQVSFAEGSLVPSHWMARGIRAAARRELGTAGYNLALLWSNGLMAYLGVAWVARRLYRRGYNRLATGSEFRRRPGGHGFDRTLTALLTFLDSQTRLLIVKDFRTFRRDPAQWAQVLIFTGLIALYFSNVRRFFMGDIGWVYQNSISLLNLCAVALLLCTYTGRFIYPLLSLEGRRFWILGLLPLRRQRLLWGEFAFSATGTLLLAEALIILSDLMLEMPWVALYLHVLTVGVLTLGLSGLSVGLGACMPNFRESDPSKIAVGFGGTLNLVIGLAFLIVVIGLMAGPWHLQAVGGGPGELSGPWAGVWVGLGVLLGLGVGTAAVIVPLRLGAEALRRMEF